MEMGINDGALTKDLFECHSGGVWSSPGSAAVAVVSAPSPLPLLPLLLLPPMLPLLLW